MAHYYDETVTTPSQPFTFDVTCLGHAFTFHSDRGVFAKDGLDFASRLLVEHTEIEANETVLDLGCGIGVMGLITARAKAAKVTCSDVNERAIALTKKNAEALDLPVHVVKSTGFEALPDSFDHIITNPPIRIGKPAMYALLDDAFQHLKSGGSLWVVMHKKHGVESFISHAKSWGTLETMVRKKGFKVLRLKHAVDDLTVM